MPTPAPPGRRTFLAVAAVALGCGLSQARQGPGPDAPKAPYAKVQGRVIAKQAGANVAGLRVVLRGMGTGRVKANPVGLMEAETRTDADGRFRFDRLSEGTVHVFVEDAPAPWTSVAAAGVEVRPGWTRAVRVDLVRGVEVTGLVLRRTGTPYGGVEVGMYGAGRPRGGTTPLVATTDDRGRYRFLLPPGEASFHVLSEPEGEANRAAIIPEGADRLEVPPILAGPVLVVGGRVVDAAGVAVEGASVSVIGGRGEIADGIAATTDARGEFRLPPGLNGGVPAGSVAVMRIQLRGGGEQKVAARPEDDGTVRLVLDPPRGPLIPEGIAPGLDARARRW
ncbi:MSCRAMM family protein [Aquisphaera giovannonii]|nr:carboxypeptidase-like regulatory domain-containing protein [Aquisphaera giovannonii]